MISFISRKIRNLIIFIFSFSESWDALIEYNKDALPLLIENSIHLDEMLNALNDPSYTISIITILLAKIKSQSPENVSFL